MSESIPIAIKIQGGHSKILRLYCTLYICKELTQAFQRFNRHSSELRSINHSAEDYDKVTHGHHWLVKDQHDLASDSQDMTPEKPRRSEWRDFTTSIHVNRFYMYFSSKPKCISYSLSSYKLKMKYTTLLCDEIEISFTFKLK